MKELELKIKSHLLNKKITDIEFYNINDNYIVFDPDSKWVFDGGIQVKFENDYFSYGFDQQSGGFDFSLEQPIDKLFRDLPFYSINAKNINGIAALLNSEIEDVSLKWQFYREFDENGELKEEKIYVPVEFGLKFNCGNTLQLALFNFELRKDTFEIVNAEYNLAGTLLISLNKNQEITFVEDL